MQHVMLHRLRDRSLVLNTGSVYVAAEPTGIHDEWRVKW